MWPCSHPQGLSPESARFIGEHLIGSSCNRQKANESFRGTQREYSSKPLKHGIVKRVLYLNGGYGHIFIPYKLFICSDFLAEILVILKL